MIKLLQFNFPALYDVVMPSCPPAQINTNIPPPHTHTSNKNSKKAGCETLLPPRTQLK